MEFLEGGGEIGTRFRQIGVYSERLPAMRDRVVKASQFRQDKAQIAVREGISGHLNERLYE